MASMFDGRSVVVQQSVRPKERPAGLTSMFGDRSVLVSLRPKARPEADQTVVEQERQAVGETLQRIEQPTTTQMQQPEQVQQEQQQQVQQQQLPEANLDFLKADQPTYSVQSGDTLESIVKDAAYSLSDLLSINPQIEDPGKIGIGQKIYIPTEDQITVPYQVSSYTASQSGDILDFISKGEGDYNSSNRGTRNNKIVGSTNNTFINGNPLAESTIGEIMQAQKEGLFAVGRYQFIPSTFRIVVDQLGIPEDAVFTPELQDRMGLQLLMGNKRPKLAAYLRGEDVDVNTAMLEFAKEWASVPDPNTGKSYYAGTGNNALHSVQETRAMLESAREVFSKEP